MRKQQFATSLPARENPFQLNPTESNCTQRTNLHHFPHTPTETKQKNRSWVSLKHSQLYKITICFFLTIPYTFYHPNQPNKSAPKKTTNQHSDGNAEHPQGASPSISPAPAPKPPGDMAFGFVAEEFLGESVIDAIYDGKLIYLEWLTNPSNVFWIRHWILLLHIHGSASKRKRCFRVGHEKSCGLWIPHKNHDSWSEGIITSPTRYYGWFRVESQCLNLQLQKFFNLLNDLTWEVRKATKKQPKSPCFPTFQWSRGGAEKSPVCGKFPVLIVFWWI